MIGAGGLVNAGLTGDCRDNGQTVWTYDQGLAIGGFTCDVGSNSCDDNQLDWRTQASGVNAVVA